MNYLYGDSTPSPLKSNFLEFLRDAIDFCVFALLADDRIRLGREHVEMMRRNADEQGAQLDAFVSTIAKAIDQAPKGDAGGPASRCAAQLAGNCGEALRAFQDEIRRQLSADVAEAEAKENAERSACKHALEQLLVPHDPPDAVDVVTIALGAHEANIASSAGQAPFGLAWAFDLAIPQNNLWASMVRVDRVVPVLEIRAPQLSGWLSKEVKVKAQRIERHVVTEYVDDGETVSVKLRAEPTSRAGFDAQINPAGKRVESIERVADEGGKEAGAVGAFDLEADDVAKLVDLAEKLRAATRDFERRRLASATVDGGAFEALPNFTTLVTRMIATMTPIVREIADRSLTSTELVLRSLLGNDRREEIFVTKASLREKYAQLPGGLRAHFAPLALAPAASKKAEASKDITNVGVVRSELPPSKPPSKAPGPTANAALQPTIPRAAPIPTPAPMIAPAPAPAPAPAADLEVRPSSPGPNPAEPKTVEEMVAELKRIVGLIKKGSIDEAYRAFEALFSADSFESFRPEDQRQALKIMVLRQTPPSPAPEAVVDAYLQAITHLQRLVESSGDAADFEMLGLSHLVIDDTETAAKMFQQGLAIEREKNPSSELCGRLMKHVSSI